MLATAAKMFNRLIMKISIRGKPPNRIYHN